MPSAHSNTPVCIHPHAVSLPVPETGGRPFPPCVYPCPEAHITHITPHFAFTVLPRHFLRTHLHSQPVAGLRVSYQSVLRNEMLLNNLYLEVTRVLS